MLRVCVRSKYLNKLNFDLLTQGCVWGGEGGGAGVGVCGKNICYHVAAFVIPLNLICNIIPIGQRPIALLDSS